MFSNDHRDHIAFDIETTGFLVEQVITVAGFHLPDRQATIILNTDAMDADPQAIKQHVENESGYAIEMVTVPTEADLLHEMRRWVFERFDKNYNKLVAFNGETWRGGFDLPFVRTACAHHDADWPFEGVVYSDLYEAVQKRFNTTMETHTDGGVTQHKEQNDLVTAHRILCNPKYEFDPFEQSSEAVACYQRAEFEPLVLHNLSDIHRTWELGEVVKEYASPRDLEGTKL